MGAQLFATHSYDDVRMENVAEQAGVSRALLYRHFPGKRDLLGAIYQRAADQLLVSTQLDPAIELTEQVAAGLDAHIDYFIANRNTVLAANRVLAGDPTIQSIISNELAILRARLLDAIHVDPDRREIVSAVLMSWLVFVRNLCVEWLERGTASRDEVRDVCLGALLGALAPIVEPATGG